MVYEVVIIDQSKGKTLADMELIADNKKEVLILLSDNIGDIFEMTSNIKIGIREIG